MIGRQTKNYQFSAFLLFITLIYFQCDLEDRNKSILSSPSKNIQIQFLLLSEGVPAYKVKYKDKVVIDTSRMGFDIKDRGELKPEYLISDISKSNSINTWELPWGEQTEVLDHFNELVVDLTEKYYTKRKLRIHFKAYDDGIGFRYEFQAEEGKDSMTILDENTEFKLTNDHLCWWIPGDWDIYEHLYNTTSFSQIDAISKRDHPNLAQTYIPYNAVNTPITMRTAEGLHLSFHEANLSNYPGMTLKVDTTNLSMVSELVGSDRLRYKAKFALPFKTPWRSIQIAEKATDLIASNLILNLNDPNKLGEIEWFRPMKYVGIWWEMHLGVSSWNIESDNHGATTENAKRYIDFAAENEIGGVLVEGWNKGWDHWIGFNDREGVFDFVSPYPDYNLEEVVDYASNKGVELLMHHETSAAPRTYDQQLDTAYSLMNELGIHAVKTGYVGKIIPEGEYHHGQWMVNHYRKVLLTAAKNKAAVNAHEPIKATGIRRTYPNAISREGLRGQEFNAWSMDGGNPPEHLPIVAFTRMLAGPIDFTPGVFEMRLKSKPDNKINTTLAQQLALYVVIYSPIQMACDLPENYKDQPGFQFIRDVGVDWEKTIVLNGEVGDFVTIARKEKETGNWFIGSITDENSREIKLDFDFLEEGNIYTAILYRDGERANYQTNPTDLIIDTLLVDRSSNFNVTLAEGGGMALSLFPKNQ